MQEELIIGDFKLIRMYRAVRWGKPYWFAEVECINCGKRQERRKNIFIKSKKRCSCAFLTGYGEITGTTWSNIVSSEPQCFITAKYGWELFLKQDRRCAITGVELFFNTSKQDLFKRTASLDRIDSSLGHIEGNVQWVHRAINFMKQEFSMDKFLYYVEAIVRHNQEFEIQKDIDTKLPYYGPSKKGRDNFTGSSK